MSKNASATPVVALLAFLAGACFALITKQSDTLLADPQCACARNTTLTTPWPSSTSTIQCVGTGIRAGGAVCTPGGDALPCLLTETVIWARGNPPKPCTATGPNTGVIGPVGVSNNALFFFDAAAANQPVAYATIAPCTHTLQSFGWRLDVLHWTSQFTPTCQCLLTSPVPIFIMDSWWDCQK